MKQDPPSCSIARLEYFFLVEKKTFSSKTRKQTKPKPPEGRRKRRVANTRRRQMCSMRCPRLGCCTRRVGTQRSSLQSSVPTLLTRTLLKRVETATNPLGSMPTPGIPARPVRSLL